MKREEYLAILEKRLQPKRFQHSLGVEQAAVHLAKIYRADQEKAALAGLLHDYAKNLPNELLLKKAIEFGIVLDDVEYIAYPVLHGPVGAKLLKEELNIDDPVVLQAIVRHTTGGKDMTLMDKIIYLADYIEVNRNADEIPNLEKVRQKAEENLDEALSLVVKQTIEYLLYKGVCIDQNTIDLWNSLVQK